MEHGAVYMEVDIGFSSAELLSGHRCSIVSISPCLVMHALDIWLVTVKRSLPRSCGAADVLMGVILAPGGRQCNLMVADCLTECSNAFGSLQCLIHVGNSSLAATSSITGRSSKDPSRSRYSAANAAVRKDQSSTVGISRYSALSPIRCH